MCGHLGTPDKLIQRVAPWLAGKGAVQRTPTVLRATLGFRNHGNDPLWGWSVNIAGWGVGRRWGLQWPWQHVQNARTLPLLR